MVNTTFQVRVKDKRTNTLKMNTIQEEKSTVKIYFKHGDKHGFFSLNH